MVGTNNMPHCMTHPEHTSDTHKYTHTHTHTHTHTYIYIGHRHQNSGVAATKRSRVHRTVFISVTLHPKQYKNFVLCYVNSLEYPCHYVESQTAFNPPVSSINLLTVLLHQSVPILGMYHTSSK